MNELPKADGEYTYVICPESQYVSHLTESMDHPFLEQEHAKIRVGNRNCICDIGGAFFGKYGHRSNIVALHVLGLRSALFYRGKPRVMISAKPHLHLNKYHSR